MTRCGASWYFTAGLTVMSTLIEAFVLRLVGQLIRKTDPGQVVPIIPVTIRPEMEE